MYEHAINSIKKMIIDNETTDEVKRVAYNWEKNFGIDAKSNELSIKSLQAKIKGNIKVYEELWQQSINLKDIAKAKGDEAQILQENASRIEACYHTLTEEFSK